MHNFACIRLTFKTGIHPTLSVAGYVSLADGNVGFLEENVFLTNSLLTSYNLLLGIRWKRLGWI